MELDKLNITRARKILQGKDEFEITLDDILELVKDSKLAMYVKEAAWLKLNECDGLVSTSTQKDEISIFLKKQKIEGTLYDIKINPKCINLIRQSIDEPTFYIHHYYIYEEDKETLNKKIKYNIAGWLENLKNEYRKLVFSNSVLTKSTNYCEKKIEETHQKITEINKLIKKLDESDSSTYNPIYFLDLRAEKLALEQTFVCCQPTHMSNPIKWKDVYFLKEDINNFTRGTTPEQEIKQLKKENEALRTELKKHTDKKWRPAFEFESPGLNEFYDFLELNFIQKGNVIKSRLKSDSLLIEPRIKQDYLSKRVLEKAFTIITTTRKLT